MHRRPKLLSPHLSSLYPRPVENTRCALACPFEVRRNCVRQFGLSDCNDEALLLWNTIGLGLPAAFLFVLGNRWAIASTCFLAKSMPICSRHARRQPSMDKVAASLSSRGHRHLFGRPALGNSQDFGARQGPCRHPRDRRRSVGAQPARPGRQSCQADSERGALPGDSSHAFRVPTKPIPLQHCASAQSHMTRLQVLPCKSQVLPRTNPYNPLLPLNLPGSTPDEITLDLWRGRADVRQADGGGRQGSGLNSSCPGPHAPTRRCPGTRWCLARQGEALSRR